MIALPLVALDVLVIALWTIAAALAIALIMDKLGAILSGVPWVGGKLSDAATRMAQAITNACGSMLSGIDHLIGAAWSHLAHYMEGLFSQFVAHSSLIAHLARLVGDGIYRLTGLSSLVHSLSKVVHVVLHRFVTIGRELERLGHRVKRLEREIAQGIGDDVLPRIRTLEREIGRVEHTVIPAIESEEQALAKDITALGEYTRANFLSSATDAIAAAVAVALGTLGLGGLRCSNFTRLLGKWGCGLGTLLDDLLGLLIAGLALESVCEFLPLLEAAFGAIIGPMVHLLNEVPLGACEQTPDSWARLSVPAGPLPPAQALGSFPT